MDMRACRTYGGDNKFAKRIIESVTARARVVFCGFCLSQCFLRVQLGICLRSFRFESHIRRVYEIRVYL